jgi:DNA modification methylase
MITINLMKGDCLERMKEIPDKSVDTVLTDPPYGMDYQSAWRSKEKRFKKIANDKKPFVWFLYDAFRILKDGGSIITFSDWKNAEAWRLALEWAGFNVKSQVIWNREVHGMGDLKASFAPMHDVIWFAVKGDYKHPGKRPKSVINSQRISGEKLVHPNEKPVDLMLELIKSVTPSDGSVLDPFMGSGSTGVACKNLNRNFVGIERDEKYFEIAKERIEKA